MYQDQFSMNSKLSNDLIVDQSNQLQEKISHQKEKIHNLKAKSQELQQSEKRLALALAEKDREVEKAKQLYTQQEEEHQQKLGKKKAKYLDLLE